MFSIHDVLLGTVVQSVKSVELGRKGVRWGSDGIIQNRVLLLHYCGQVCRQFRANLVSSKVSIQGTSLNSSI